MSEKIILKNAETPGTHGIEAYEAAGGYQALTKVLRETSPEDLIQLVKDSNLKGRGGAGFPTGVKWGFVPKETDKPKYLCCNADESEPGTFKDRVIMEGDPHMMLEGMALASYAIGAETAYIYIRGNTFSASKGWKRPWKRPMARDTWAGISSAPATISTSTCTGGRALTSAARRRPCSNP